MEARKEEIPDILYSLYAENLKAVETLLKSPGVLNQVDELGRSPLHVACEIGNPHMLELVLAKNPNLDLKDIKGNTPLHLAAIYGNWMCIELLGEKGANAGISNNDSHLPLQFAVENFDDVSAYLLLKINRSAIGSLAYNDYIKSIIANESSIKSIWEGQKKICKIRDEQDFLDFTRVRDVKNNDLPPEDIQKNESVAKKSVAYGTGRNFLKMVGKRTKIEQEKANVEQSSTSEDDIGIVEGNISTKQDIQNVSGKEPAEESTKIKGVTQKLTEEIQKVGGIIEEDNSKETVKGSKNKKEEQQKIAGNTEEDKTKINIKSNKNTDQNQNIEGGLGELESAQKVKGSKDKKDQDIVIKGGDQTEDKHVQNIPGGQLIPDEKNNIHGNKDTDTSIKVKGSLPEKDNSEQHFTADPITNEDKQEQHFAHTPEEDKGNISTTKLNSPQKEQGEYSIAEVEGKDENIKQLKGELDTHIEEQKFVDKTQKQAPPEERNLRLIDEAQPVDVIIEDAAPPEDLYANDAKPPRGTEKDDEEQAEDITKKDKQDVGKVKWADAQEEDEGVKEEKLKQKKKQLFEDDQDDIYGKKNNKKNNETDIDVAASSQNKDHAAIEKEEAEKGTTEKTKVTAEKKKPQGPPAKKIDPNKKNKKGETPLHIAAAAGNLEMVVQLISMGANVNIRDFAGFTCLMKALQDKHNDIVEILLKNHAKHNFRTPKGESTLQFAVMTGNAGGVDLLARYGTNLNTRIKQATPLMAASAKGFHEVVNTLIDHGVDVNTKDIKGRTAIDYADLTNHKDIVEILIAAKKRPKKRSVKRWR